MEGKEEPSEKAWALLGGSGRPVRTLCQAPLCSQSCMWLESVLCDRSDDKTGLKLLVGCAAWYLHPVHFLQRTEVPNVYLFKPFSS